MFKEGAVTSGYRAIDVAWKLVEIGNKKGQEVTHLKIQKLIYLAHGYSLAIFGKPLVSEGVRGWKFGPVFPEVYWALRSYRASHISESCVGTISLPDAERSLLELVVGRYGTMTGIQLSWIAANDMSPWSQVWIRRGGDDGIVIPDDLIEAHFRGRLNFS